MNAVTKIAPQAATVYSGQQLDLIRRTVAKDCNPAEFDLFVMVARNTGLDPFRKQIMALVFSKGDEAKRRMSIVTGIDGLRAIAARSGRYRPDEEEPEYEFDDALIGPANPKGLVKAKVKIHIADVTKAGGWKPVTGVAYWEEFAPIRDEAAEYEWRDTGEVWADTGKPKKRKVPIGDTIRALDTSGQWGRMPRVMLAKCAEAQALRKAFPEDLSGLYEYAELDRTAALDALPSDILAEHDTQLRLDKVGASNGIMLQFFPNTALESVPLGKVADRIVATIQDFLSPKQMEWFESANLQPLREFWARSPGDALEVKKAIEKRAAELKAQDAAADHEQAA